MADANLTVAFERLTIPFDVRAFEVDTAISRPTRIVLDVVCPDPDVDLEALLGSNALVTIALPESSPGARVVWHVVCERAEQLRTEPTGLSTYRLGFVHAIGLFDLRRGYRIAQRETPIDIVTGMLAAAQLPHRVNLDPGHYPYLDMCVQYDETSLAFFCRILERAGVTWVCEPGLDATTIVLLDDPGGAGAPSPPLLYSDSPTDRVGTPWATALRRGARLRPASVTLEARDDLHPTHRLLGHGAASPGAMDHYVHRPSAGLTWTKEAPDATTPVADGRGHADHDPRWLETLATRHLEAMRADARTIDLSTNQFDLVAGRVLTVHGHPRADVADRPLLVVASRSRGTHDGEWHHEIAAVSAEKPYRAPLRTPWPKAMGVDTAIVTGAAAETIHVDEHGRVRVRFHWDHRGATGDESSCWLRVSQGWAGATHGVFSVPRVGTEVLVAYVGGDPDQPVVVGRVHNGVAPPPFDLPEHRTKTGIRTDSSRGGWNEVSLDDAAGAERILVRAEKDLEIVTQNDRRTTIEHDDATVVHNDQTLEVQGEQRVVVHKARRLHLSSDDAQIVDGSRTIAVEHDLRTDVAGSTTTSVRRDARLAISGHCDATIAKECTVVAEGGLVALVGLADEPRDVLIAAGGAISASANKPIEITSDQEIVLRVGTTFVHITEGGITLSGPKIAARGKDARLLLDEGTAKLKVAQKFQVVSDDTIAMKASGASFGLKSEAHLDGSRILLNSPTEVTDTIETEEPSPTRIQLTDQDGNPMPNQVFRVTFPDGRVEMGFLDADGSAEVDTQGSGEISFPGARRAEAS